MNACRVSTPIGLALLLLLSIGGASAATLSLDNQAQQRLGLRTGVLETRETAATVDGTGVVLDPVPLFRLQADLQTATAASLASTAEAARVQRLQQSDGNVSQRAVETAQAQAAGDSAKQQALLAEMRGSWGTALAGMAVGERAALLDAAANGRTALLRIEPLLPMEGAQPRVARLQASANAVRPVRLLGSLPLGGSAAQPAWLGVADGAGLTPGIARPVSIESDRRSRGVLLPREALLRWKGLDWVYVVVDATHFERRAVQAAQMLADGWLVGSGFAAGERIVTQGAAQLLAAETLAPAESGEE